MDACYDIPCMVDGAHHFMVAKAEKDLLKKNVSEVLNASICQGHSSKTHNERVKLFVEKLFKQNPNQVC